MWLYGSGFPKSMNIGLAIDKKNGVESKVIGKAIGNINQMPDGRPSRSQIAWESKPKEYDIKEAQNEWKGWGTALKPSFEPIIVARKPFKGSLVDNVIEYGVGGINIDECRVKSSKEDIDKLNKEWDREWNTSYKSYAENVGGSAGFDYSKARVENKGLTGRFPANTILTYNEIDKDEVCGGFPNTKSGTAVRHNSSGNTFGGNNKRPPMEDLGYNDSGSASRYFYCAKASKKDRDEGLENFIEQKVNDGREKPIDNAFHLVETQRKNTHPTVKPTELMQYLIRLVTPKGGKILDPFMGSGSTGKAVMFENKERNAEYKFIGIEKEKEYYEIANARIKWAEEYKEETLDSMQININELLEE